MSLRRRLFTLLLVSCVALVASGIGLSWLVSDGAAAREAIATAVGLRAAEALAHRLDTGLATEGPVLEALLEDLSRTLEDGTVGVCWNDGRVGAMRTLHGPFGPPRGGPHDGPHGAGPPDDGPHGPPPGEGPHGPHDEGDDTDLFPLDRERVSAACRTATADVRTSRTLAPRDVLTIAVMRTRRGPIAFALARAPRPEVPGSSLNLVFLACAGAIATLLFALTAHGAWVLRASTASLEASVDALKKDLRAPIPEPRATELAHVASHLRSFATTLAEAHERERSLLRDVEDQKRLAGLGRVVAGVAHEVRNPLAGMKLRLDTMSLRPLDPRSRVDVEKCLREIARLDRLVRTLLLVSRKRALERTPFDAAAMVAERIALAAPLAQPIDVQIASDGNARIVGEHEGLAGALDNLLRNAIEASPPGGEVGVRIHDDAGTTCIDVVDEGPGVTADRSGELFEPFFTTKGSGTGLGLVLARAAVEAHGGTLEYERRGDRTVFAMRIPNGASHG